MYCLAARCYTHARCARSPAPCVCSMFVLPINLQVNAVFSLLAWWQRSTIVNPRSKDSNTSAVFRDLRHLLTIRSEEADKVPQLTVALSERQQ